MNRYLDRVADEPEPSRRPLAVKLTWWNRAILDVLGLAGLGAGGAAVFITDLEAGPVALIAAGLLLLLIGIGGRMPSRLKIGDNEAAWEIEREAVQTFVERVAEDVPVANQREFLGALGELAEGAPQVAAPALLGYAYDTLMETELARVAAEVSDVRRVTPWKRLGEKGGLDFVIEATGNRFILVEVKASRRLSLAQVAAIMEKAQYYRETYPDRKTALLLVSRYPLSAAVRAMFMQVPDAACIVFRSREDDNELIDAITRLLFDLGSTA